MGHKYNEHLPSVDVMIGEITRWLTEGDTYQDTLLILTSDHGWCEDLDRSYGEGHDFETPLVVKCPGQTTHYDVDTAVRRGDYRTSLRLSRHGRSAVTATFDNSR